MRPGNRLGIDVGKARIGVARSDPHGMLATPIETVARGHGDTRRILEHAAEVDAIEIVIGLPLSLSGGRTPSTEDADGFARELQRHTQIPVRLVDERLSTVSAQQALHGAGRSTRSSRSVIDQVAAVIILQHALDFERASGKPPGALVDPPEGP